MAEWDTSELLEDVRNRGSLPSADVRYTDARLLAAATLELRDVLAPLLVESQAERGVYLSQVAVTAGTAEYRLPSRAIAGRWKSVGWLPTGETSYQRLRQLHDADYYRLSTTAQGNPEAFFVRDYRVTLVPTPNAAGTLYLPYYLRPAKLVAASAAAAITAVGTVLGNTAVTVATTPAGFVTGASYDIVRGTPGFELLADSRTATKVGTTYTFTGSLDSSIAVGDYLCLAGQAPFPQLPVELRGLLAARTARRALHTGGDAEGAGALDNDVTELTETATRLLASRADDEPQELGDLRQGLLRGVLR